MPTPASLNDLPAALESTNATAVLAASWEAFDVGQRIADSVDWDDDGVDEIQTVLAAQACTAGRALLPLPRDGRPLPLPEPAADSTAACAEVLRAVHRSLIALAQTFASPDNTPLLEAAAFADDAARALDALRAA